MLRLHYSFTAQAAVVIAKTPTADLMHVAKKSCFPETRIFRSFAGNQALNKISGQKHQ